MSCGRSTLRSSSGRDWGVMGVYDGDCGRGGGACPLPFSAPYASPSLGQCPPWEPVSVLDTSYSTLSQHGSPLAARPFSAARSFSLRFLVVASYCPSQQKDLFNKKAPFRIVAGQWLRQRRINTASVTAKRSSSVLGTCERLVSMRTGSEGNWFL